MLIYEDKHQTGYRPIKHGTNNVAITRENIPIRNPIYHFVIGVKKLERCPKGAETELPLLHKGLLKFNFKPLENAEDPIVSKALNKAFGPHPDWDPNHLYEYYYGEQESEEAEKTIEMIIEQINFG